MKRINIFGTSEKLMEFGPRQITRLLNHKCDSLGINSFTLKYPRVDYWLFSDQNMVEKIEESGVYDNQKIICSVWASWKINKTLGWNVHELFERNNIQNEVNNSGWLALWWAVKEGYTHANLYGVLDGEYRRAANGNVYYKNAIEGERFIEGKLFDRFLKDVETGFNGRIKICRPLLESSEEVISSEN